MTQRDESVNLARLAERLALWLVLGAFVAYWWFMARATKGLLGELRALGQWFRDWRAE
jgi:hypothetical protein